ncbi:aldo/keto reductase [Streptomyces sp. ARC32]
MGVLTWSPLSWGLLTGKYGAGRQTPISPGRRKWGPRHMTDPDKYAAVEKLRTVADNAGISLTHMAIAFVLAHLGVTSAIIGPRTLDQLDDLLAGAERVLGDDVLDAIDAIAPPGADIGVTDIEYRPPAIQTPALRRRPPAERGIR